MLAQIITDGGMGAGYNRLKAGISMAATVHGKFSPQQTFHCRAGLFLISLPPLHIQNVSYLGYIAVC